MFKMTNPFEAYEKKVTEFIERICDGKFGTFP